MNYCTYEDIQGHIPEARLVEVTDDLAPNATGEVKVDIVEKAIKESSTLIDSYVRKRFPRPFQSVPEVLRMVCVDLTIYNLYERVTEMNISEGMKLRYNNAIALLQRIADGKQDIGVDPDEPVPETGFAVASKVSGGTAMFTLDSMRF
jgi:Mu-like prophage protein gp36